MDEMDESSFVDTGVIELGDPMSGFKSTVEISTEDCCDG
jgi:hypothetical protein